MALPVTIPNTFANATSSIPLSQLDANFGTLANAVNGLNSGSETLANLKATTANVVTLTVTGNATIGDASADTVTLNSTLTANTAVIFAAGTSAAPSITTTGDTNTGIFFPAADTIAFTEGGAEAMRIDSSGKVGIGLTSPNATLHAQGSATTDGSIKFNQQLTDTTAYNSSPQSGDMVSLKYNTGGDYAGMGGWSIIKENATDGNFAGAMLFHTRANGGSITERMRIDSSGNVGIGTASFGGGGRLSVQYGTTDGLSGTGYRAVSVYSTAAANGDQPGIILGFDTAGAGIVAARTNATGQPLAFWTYNGSAWGERARITSDGAFLVGTTTVYDSSQFTLETTAQSGANSNGLGIRYIRNDGGGASLLIDRVNSDGTLISFNQAGAAEGSISVSGATVSYNAFCGGHWSQLQEGRGYNPDIPRGTVMSSIGEMAEWKSVTWTETIEHPAIPAVEAKEAVLDEEGNVVEPAVEAVEGKDAWTESINKRDTYLGNLPVGATFEEDGFTKTVVDDGNERLPKVKISDVVGDKAVYGVFQTWDEAQDMLITSLGAFVVRIASGVTVQIGDLLESNGDGCAKVQDDDVIRSKTIGKVTSTVATATYADGSYTVPCVIYCG